MHGRTDAVLAMQAFLERFGYLPATGEELLATVSLHKSRRYVLDDATRLFRNWQGGSGYRFHIRDFHLLSQLARDPLRKDLRRPQLLLQLGQATKSRRHVQHAVGERGKLLRTSDFWLKAERLDLGDLWALYLINEMLDRDSVRKALRIMAARDLADRQRAWGGLVLYQNGRAEATLYPSSRSTPPNDLVYMPSVRALRDARDALCRFHAHFESVNNAQRAGPGPEELRDAMTHRYRCLVLTRVSEHAFCAHYYNQKGIVISLGIYPFG
jgi:hypothetical protein